MQRLAWCAAVGGVVVLVGCWGAAPSNPPGPEDGPGPVAWSADMQPIADGNNRFALDLYAQLHESETGNFLFSPYSAHTALAMTATGARGRTRDEMVSVLHLPTDEQKQLASGDLGRFYTQPRKDIELAVANALWGQRGFGWRPDWLAGQKEHFGAGFNEADFATNPDAERQRINRWVEGQTRDRIKELLLPPQVTRSTTMVLANAVYFKGKWASQFNPKRTHNATFHLASDGRVTVPMMSGTMKCGYSGWDGITMVELPYEGGELSMVVILPQLPNGLAAIEKRLNSKNLTEWLGTLRDRASLQVSLPRFTIESRFELPRHLQALGMKQAFNGADFSGMATTSPGSISEVAHKAFVDVNEEGTEAAAATAISTTLSSDPLPFYADRPFFFLIRDTKHGTILFMGRVMNAKG